MESDLVKKLIEEKRFIDDQTLERLRREIDKLIEGRVEMLYDRFGGISGKSDATTSLLEGLKALKYKIEMIDEILNRYDIFRFHLSKFGLFVRATTYESNSDRWDAFELLGCYNGFVEKCVENPKYVHKLDKVFDFVEEFLNGVVDKLRRELERKRRR
ncbi:MAG: hypothetical protein QXG39_02080 [Candidatus Aenigmatarchaeota archaeon]